jgi:hypothetical protein
VADPKNELEVVLHIERNTLDEQRRNALVSRLESQDGVSSAEVCPLRYHLLLVECDRQDLTSQDILHLVGGERVTAQLIGPI